ncbi:hypothetical protein ILUMI_11657 [Ignelater luminosus]|uniref:Reverse transcriptase/retrotransposon-derived protein RNase H-like domain-containing protein n=1 Tax=Ignelater luminosus TaxID=2038154 RepID=A0A8K0CY14_IGNLU|nr:hypothetical protein ILUMI_11657 [Ignelater luminosus]
MLNFYRRLIPGAAHLQAPLNTYLTDSIPSERLPIEWTSETDPAFDTCKQSLTSATLMGHPAHDAPLRLTINASNVAIDAVLKQHADNTAKLSNETTNPSPSPSDDGPIKHLLNSYGNSISWVNSPSLFSTSLVATTPWPTSCRESTLLPTPPRTWTPICSTCSPSHSPLLCNYDKWHSPAPRHPHTATSPLRKFSSTYLKLYVSESSTQRTSCRSLEVALVRRGPSQQTKVLIHHLRPVPTAHHSRHAVFAPSSLNACSYVFLRDDAVKKPLQPPTPPPQVSTFVIVDDAILPPATPTLSSTVTIPPSPQPVVPPTPPSKPSASLTSLRYPRYGFVSRDNLPAGYESALRADAGCETIMQSEEHQQHIRPGQIYTLFGEW